jgi:hypothetical protein
MWMPFIVIRYLVFFLFCHCTVCHSTINGFWLTLWFLQTFHWYIMKLVKSCYYENNQEQIHNTNGVIRIEWQSTQWGERDKRVIRIEWQTTQWGERDKRVIIIEWQTTQWGERDKRVITIEWHTTQWGERDKRVIRIEWQATQWGERDKRTKHDLQNTTQNQ